MKIYFASPLFTQMELMFNEVVVKEIRRRYPEIEVYLPQEQGDINDKTAYADSMKIAKFDTDNLLESDLMIAVLDGQTIDAGVASEVGVAYQAGIPILGYYSDSRQQGFDNKEKLDALSQIGESQFSYVNLYTVGLIKLNGTLVNSTDKLIEAIDRYRGDKL